MKNVLSFVRFQLENVVLVVGDAVSWLLSPTFETLVAHVCQVALAVAYALVILTPLILAALV